MPKGITPVEHVLPGDGGLVQKSEINCHDVICSKGYSMRGNPGNVNYNAKVRALKAEYLTSKSEEKKRLAAQLVEGIRHDVPPGRFLEVVDPTANIPQFRDIGDKKAWGKTMVALRKDGPQILAAMKNLTPANAGRKRGQCEISGNMEDEHIRTMARECDRQMENNMEEDDADAASSRSKRVQAEEEDAASSRSKRVQVPWETRYKELVAFKGTYGHTRVPQNYYLNYPLGRWVQKQRTEYSNRMKGKNKHLNDTRLKLLQDLGFEWKTTARRNSSSSNCDTTHDDASMLPDPMEGFVRLEQGDQELNKAVLRNAQTLFVTTEEVRKRQRNQIRRNYRATTSTSTSVDNNPPEWSGLGDLNYDTLKHLTEFFRKGDDWKRKISQVCSDWLEVALRFDASLYDLSPEILLNVFGCLELPEVVSASHICRAFNDLLPRALLRSELLPCYNDPQWAPIFRMADKVLENAKSLPLLAKDAPKYGGFLQCEDCGREIAHPPSQEEGAKQTYMHACCSPEYKRGGNEILTIADCVSRSGNLSSEEKHSIIDELVCSSGIPEKYKKGRYFRNDATSPEVNIDGMLSEFFMRIVSQGESFEDICQKTYRILGRTQEVLLSILVAFIVFVGPCKVGSTSTGDADGGNLKALPRTNSNGSDAYSIDLFMKEAPLAAVKFGNLLTGRAGEGFLIAAGSLLGAVVNKRLEYGRKSTSETTMIYLVGLRTNSLWEHKLNHSRKHYDFGRRLLPPNGEESEVLSASSMEQEQPGQALSEVEQALEQQLALERDERQALEQLLARERQSRLALERQLEEERRANAEERRANAEEEQRRSAEQQRNTAEFTEILGNMQALQQRMMESNYS